MIEACGAGSTTRVSPGVASPNWNARASIAIVSAAAAAATTQPRNFVHCCSRGVEPSQ